MTVSERIQQRLQEAFAPRHLELINESHMHAGPATESHFKLIMVSDAFQGKKRVSRHQMVYRLLQDELQSGGQGSVHALALHLYTPEEWLQAEVAESPLCAGKNK